MRLFFRLQVSLMGLFLLLLGLLLGIARLQESSGTLVFEAGVGTTSYFILVDYDSQRIFRQDTNPNPEPEALAWVSELDTNASILNFSSARSQTRVPLPRYVRPIAALWNAHRGAILLAYREGNNALLGWVHPITGERQAFAIYDDFQLGFGDFSPNERYVLLREAGLVRPLPVPQPMLLVDLSTGAALDLASPSFAYWSPDSRYLALGYKENGQYESRVERYEIATGQRLTYPIRVAQEDTPFFYDNDFRSNGLLWSPDSQTLAALNRDNQTLYFLSADGTIVEHVGGRITPLRWSPDNRWLLGIGYSNGDVGAFLVDASTGAAQVLRSPILLQDALSDFAWSPNSRFVAVLTHSSGVLFEQRLSLYDTNGQLVGRPLALGQEMVFATFDGTLRWLEKDRAMWGAS